MFKLFSKFGRPTTAFDSDQVEALKNHGKEQTVDERKRKTTISYDPTLIAALMDDHESLKVYYLSIWESFSNKRYEQIPAKMIRFKTSFQSHVLKENVKFYVYLEQSLINDAHSIDVIKDFRKEMNVIASKVISFCNTYTGGEFTQDRCVTFRSEFNAIKDALLHRIEREERDLYNLYHR